MSKRYVLLLAESDLSDEDVRSLGDVVKSRYAGAKVIAVKGNPRAVIVKTTNVDAPLLREARARLRVGRNELVSVLTSGAIGNLKKRASEAAANGKVP